MWVVLSRGRPNNAVRLAAACRDTGMSTPAVIVLDDDDPSIEDYCSLDCPRNWIMRIGARAPLSDLYNRVFAEFPDREWYGVLADDVVPRTRHWDIALIEAAGRDGLGAPSGGHHHLIAPHFCLGGDLVREMSWLMLPGLDRTYGDTVWNEIARARGVFRFRPGVVIDHLHFSNGKALFDKTYRKPNKARDKSIYDAWRAKFTLEKETT